MAGCSAAHVPDWAKDAVWYQVFPERFRRGSTTNDPTPETAGIAAPNWERTPWTWDWYRQAAWEQARGPFYRTVYERRYGGDLVGLRERLGYLQDLGITALYLNPVFTAESLHKYDGSCFHHIDPTLGPDRDGDLALLAGTRETEDPASWVWTAADRFFLDLVEEIHRRGMRIILDGVFNHCGRAFFAFQDLLERGRDSRYRDWFTIKRWRQDGSFDYDGWFNHKSLPEFDRDDENLVPPVKDYIVASTERWMRPVVDGREREGIDGWRLDVAYCVPLGFWRDWHAHVRELNPEAYTTAEIVTRADAYLEGDTFSAVMNYMWLYPTARFFSLHGDGSPASQLKDELDALHEAYGHEVVLGLQNLLDSHDVARIVTMLANGDVPMDTWEHYFESSRVKHNRAFRMGKPGPEAFQALRRALVFQMTCPGAPMLYYGTEVGMWGANDPDNRQPMLWDDLPAEPEVHGPYGKLPEAPRTPDLELFDFTRRLIAMRKQSDALRRGILAWWPTDNERVLAYERAAGGERVVVVIHAGEQPFTIELPRHLNLWTEAPGPAGEMAVEPGGWLAARVE